MTFSTLSRAILIGASSIALLAACGNNRAEEAAPTETSAPAASPETTAEMSEDALLDQIIAESTKAYFRAHPRNASYANLSAEDAGGRYNNRFETPGIAGVEERRAVAQRLKDRLAGLDMDKLSPKHREMAMILTAQDADLAELYSIADDAGYVLGGSYHSPYVFNQISGLHVDLPQFMTQAHGLSNAADAEAYVERLDAFYDLFMGDIEIFEANAGAGVLPPDYAMEGAINNAARFIAGEPEDNILVSHLAGTLEELSVENRDELVASAVAAVETSVYPAYEALLEMLRRHQDDATHDAGIWDIPQGDDLYAALAKVNGESERTPGGIHELGLAEVGRIHKAMEARFEQIGMTEGSIGDRLAALTADPEQLFPNTDEGREELLSYVRELAEEADDVMADYFLVMPSIGVEVVRVPEYAEQGAPGGYYLQPAEDGSRPGLYFINLRDTATQPKFSLPTLTYHEATPGHHFQLALAVDDKQTPLRVRQVASTNGFAEGWALYSESLAEEVGLYADDPYGDIGRLRDELFRAVRLVVDTGMHEKRWSREEAIDYMVANAGMEPSGVAIEIERYSVWPGQALAYKIGMLKIQELRAAAEEALGEDFDIGAFHYQVLRDGGAPMPVLKERIQAWVEDGGPAPELN
ncbi:DUF885 domain-containing protein [Parvularcula sp. ZS-1/3]|uniref:DUF885 domain-containing protein n=1 Tax=Parvularcula mediterranea TaxID=2732508 RepID=A0A7Y3W465_9PROT|nr:DUF885 domain-containing protein [Parvularcula mediterranea]NNU15204.1 DUF885 domain-containing protein [Parvularcula mediterranea]